MRILYVEDELWHRTSVSEYLQVAGYDVETAGTLSDAFNAIRITDYRLILLDIGLPDGNGLKLVAELRRNGYTGWIILLTAHSDSQSVILGLEAGADDYVVKPFRIREIKARIDAASRRMEVPGVIQRSHGHIEIGDLVLDREFQRLVNDSGIPIIISRMEYAVLLTLMLRSPQIVTKVELKTEVWGNPYADSDAMVHSLIHRIRRKLEDAQIEKVLIESVYDKGYRLRHIS